jgi:hypothetical protein
MEITLDYGGGVSSEEEFDRINQRGFLFAKNLSFGKATIAKKMRGNN